MASETAGDNERVQQLVKVIAKSAVAARNADRMDGSIKFPTGDAGDTVLDLA